MNSHPKTAACSCDHEHEHEHEHEANCSCSQNETDCDCGHSHGEDFEKKSLVFIAISAVLFIASFFLKNNIALAIILLIACLLPGYKIFLTGAKGLLRFRFDETTLLFVAVLVAFILGEYREAAAVSLLFCVGEYFEGLAIAKSKREIAALSTIRSETAHLLEHGSAQTVPAKGIPTGSTILIKPGERVPLDAIVLEGFSQTDNSALTGESLPVDAIPGTKLLSASINLTGVLTCRTVAGYDDSTASKIIDMVANAASTKGKTETLISRFAKIYTPIIMVAALMLAVLPPLLGAGEWATWIGRALIFLVASCPCALVISIPLSFFAGVGACSKAGVLVKGTKYLELLSKGSYFVFDKTGTLTTGSMAVSRIGTLDGHTEEEVLTTALYCCSNSNHPISRAVAQRAESNAPSPAEHFEEIAGKGMLAEVNGDRVLVGSAKLMEEYGFSVSNLPAANLYVAKKDALLGYLQISDTVRPDAAQTISFLHESGHKTVMLTGDSPAAAQAVQQQLSIGECHASLLPQDKLQKVVELRQNGTVLFVGDGINDAPVLAGADAGIAMGMGSDAAIEAADIVLLSNRLSALIDAVRLSARTMSIARFNIIFALGIKAIVLLLGALGYAQMWMAVVADVGVSILTVLNATRLLKKQK